MSWLMRILVGLGIALALLIVIVLVIGNWGTGGPETQALSMTVGGRTVTVAGHYKNITQESLTDGVKVMVDGHEINVSPDQLTVDGKIQVIEPDQDVMVYVSKDGKVQVKVVQSGEGASEEAPEEP
ncbi:MAG: hypothetical protein ACRECX_04670 [Methyloceanibacter sp.]|uniref:hypothetical protein n=1 Tax=Methyloceanibacter sp. TaxID=1965321 RepID=UPI003D6D3318